MNQQVATVENNELANVVQLPVDASQSDRLMAAIVTATSDPSTDVAKMESMYNLYDRVRAHDAELAYKDAMAKTQAAIPKVIKNKTNEQTRSTYADLGAILDAVMPIAASNGLSMSFREDVDGATEGYVKVIGRNSHSGGHYEDFPLVMPVDVAGIQGKVNKTAIHGKASAVAYCERYITNMVYCVSMGDDDGNSSAKQSDLLENMFNNLLAHNDALRNNIEGVAAIKQAIIDDDRSTAAEVVEEMGYKTDYKAMWIATTKGGIWTTAEREWLKSVETQQAFHAAGIDMSGN